MRKLLAVLTILFYCSLAGAQSRGGTPAARWFEEGGAVSGRPRTIVVSADVISFSGNVMSLDVIGTTSADATYLRLDCENDPLTGLLTHAYTTTTHASSPIVYDLDYTTTATYSNPTGTTVLFDGKMEIDDTITLDAILKKTLHTAFNFRLDGESIVSNDALATYIQNTGMLFDMNQSFTASGTDAPVYFMKGVDMDMNDTTSFDFTDAVTLTAYGINSNVGMTPTSENGNLVGNINVINSIFAEGANSELSSGYVYGIYADVGTGVGASNLDAYGVYIDAVDAAFNSEYAIYVDQESLNSLLAQDNGKALFGTADDASIYYDGTNLIVNPKEVGSGFLDVQGVLNATALSVNDTSLGVPGLIDVVREESNTADVLTVARLRVRSSQAPAAGIGSAFSLRAENSAGEDANAGYFGGKLLNVNNGSEIGEMIIAPDWQDSKLVNATRQVKVGAADANTAYLKMVNDNAKIYLGAGDDASIYYDNANLVVNTMETGTGSFRVQPTDLIPEVVEVVQTVNNPSDVSTNAAYMVFLDQDITGAFSDAESMYAFRADQDITATYNGSGGDWNGNLRSFWFTPSWNVSVSGSNDYDPNYACMYGQLDIDDTVTVTNYGNEGEATGLYMRIRNKAELNANGQSLTYDNKGIDMQLINGTTETAGTVTVNQYGAFFDLRGQGGNPTTLNQYGVYLDMRDGGTATTANNKGIVFVSANDFDSEYFIYTEEPTDSLIAADGGRLMLGTGEDFQLAFNGQDAIISPDAVGMGMLKVEGAVSADVISADTLMAGDLDAGNYVSMDEIGIRLYGTATTWDDLKFPASAVRLSGSKPPAPTEYKGGLVLAFENAIEANEEIIYFTVQMPHSWKIGSDIEPHVHWTAPDDNAGTVVWKMTYSWADIGADFPAELDSTGTESINAQADQHIYTELPTISSDETNVSSILLCSLKRQSSLDTYASDAYLCEIDIHYEIDSLGSNEEASK